MLLLKIIWLQLPQLKKLINMKVRTTLILALNFSLFGQNKIKMGFSYLLVCTPEESLKMQDWVFRMGVGFYIFCEKKQIFSKCGNSSSYSELCQQLCTVDQNFLIQCSRQESIFKLSQASIQAYTLVYIVGFIRTPSLIGPIGPTPFNLSFFLRIY